MHQKFPTLLILTPTLGKSKFLDETMECIYALKCRFLHAIICPQERVPDLTNRYPRSLVIADRGSEEGLYGALNAGLQAVQSKEWDFFTYLNDDDLFGPDLPKMLSKHMTPENLKTVGFGYITNIDSTGMSIGGMTVGPFPSHYPAILQMGISPTGQQGMIFGRDVVRKIGVYSMEYRICADLDYWCRAMAAGFRFKLYNLNVGKFRIQKGQISSDVSLLERDLKEITKKHFPQPIGQIKKIISLIIFKAYNIPRYLDRFKRVGIKSSNALFKY